MENYTSDSTQYDIKKHWKRILVVVLLVIAVIVVAVIILLTLTDSFLLTFITYDV